MVQNFLQVKANSHKYGVKNVHHFFIWKNSTKQLSVKFSAQYLLLIIAPKQSFSVYLKNCVQPDKIAYIPLYHIKALQGPRFQLYTNIFCKIAEFLYIVSNEKSGLHTFSSNDVVFHISFWGGGQLQTSNISIMHKLLLTTSFFKLIPRVTSFPRTKFRKSNQVF